MDIYIYTTYISRVESGINMQNSQPLHDQHISRVANERLGDKSYDAYLVIVSEPGALAVSCMVNTACEREDRIFMDVSATLRLANPCIRRFCATSSFAAR